MLAAIAGHRGEVVDQPFLVKYQEPATPGLGGHSTPGLGVHSSPDRRHP